MKTHNRPIHCFTYQIVMNVVITYLKKQTLKLKNTILYGQRLARHWKRYLNQGKSHWIKQLNLYKSTFIHDKWNKKDLWSWIQVRLVFCLLVTSFHKRLYTYSCGCILFGCVIKQEFSRCRKCNHSLFVISNPYWCYTIHTIHRYQATLSC